MARALPHGMHSVIPTLVVRGCAAAITFYQRAFGAVEVARVPAEDGVGIGHAELRLGDSILFLADEQDGGPEAPRPDRPAQVVLRLYVDDADEALRRALRAGARPIKAPVEDAALGDRGGLVADPFGYQWRITVHVRHVALDDEREAVQELDQPSSMPA
jgi:PhnB protein